MGSRKKALEHIKQQAEQSRRRLCAIPRFILTSFDGERTFDTPVLTLRNGENAVIGFTSRAKADAFQASCPIARQHIVAYYG